MHERVAVKLDGAIIGAEHGLRNVVENRIGAAMMRRSIAVTNRLVLCTGFSDGRDLAGPSALFLSFRLYLGLSGEHSPQAPPTLVVCGASSLAAFIA